MDYTAPEVPNASSDSLLQSGHTTAKNETTARAVLNPDGPPGPAPLKLIVRGGTAATRYVGAEAAAAPNSGAPAVATVPLSKSHGRIIHRAFLAVT